MQQQVQGVLFPEKIFDLERRLALKGQGRFLQIAAGAEAPVAGPGEDDQPYPRVLPGLIQMPAQPPDHLPVQGVEDPGPVEDQL